MTDNGDIVAIVLFSYGISLNKMHWLSYKTDSMYPYLFAKNRSKMCGTFDMWRLDMNEIFLTERIIIIYS